MENKKLTKCNKRKADLEEEEEQQSELLSTTCSIQLKTRRLDANTPEEMNSNTCESVNTDHHHHHNHHVLVSSSCCSSTNTHELAIKENLKKSADLEEEEEEENKVNVQELMATSAGDSVDFSDRRESTPLREIQAEIGELESTAMPLRRSNHPRRRSTAAKAPSENELEEFFSVAEKNLQKQFIDKYNFDIVKDEPLEGRFEWVQIQLKP